MPTFEDMTVKELQKYNYNYFIIELTNELANKTVKDILSILKSILCYANSEYNCNPFSGICKGLIALIHIFAANLILL